MVREKRYLSDLRWEILINSDGLVMKWVVRAMRESSGLLLPHLLEVFAITPCNNLAQHF